MYFECWLPRPQTMDTELLSQRLTECQYSLPKHMHGHAASAPSYVFAVNIQIKQLANLQRIEIPIELHESYCIQLCSLHMQPAWVRHVKRMKKYPKKAHTREHIKSTSDYCIYSKGFILQRVPPLHRTDHYVYEA